MAGEALVIGVKADLEKAEVRALIDALGEPVSILQEPEGSWTQWNGARTAEEWADKKASARAVIWVAAAAAAAQPTWMLGKFPKAADEVLAHEVVVTVHDAPFGIFTRFGPALDLREGVEPVLEALGLQGE
jgi:hypothetical protein